MTKFIPKGMRHFNLGKRFDAIIACHSFFHLPAADQRAMFKVFQAHLNCNGILLFASGYEQG
jgi:cyclopropane fatty-acyl-phospholipid synthase-like methyltransferase